MGELTDYTGSSDDETDPTRVSPSKDLNVLLPSGASA